MKNYIRYEDDKGRIMYKEHGFNMSNNKMQYCSILLNECSNDMMYNYDDLETDIEWFRGINIDSEEARKYIKFILKCGNKMTEKNIDKLFVD